MRNTIKKHSDFARDDNAPLAHSNMFLVRTCPTRWPGDARYGLIVTKRTFKLAVHRNLAKRKLRDWIQFNQALLRDDLDYIFVARHDILDATREDGRAAMAKALRYLDKQNARKDSHQENIQHD